MADGIDVSTKRCSKCLQDKSIDDFNPKRAQCKICMREYDKNRYNNNLDYFKEKKARWDKNNKEKVSEYNKQYAEDNTEKLTQKEKDRWMNDRENQTRRHRMWRYKLTQKEMIQLELNANGRCSICKRKSDNMHVDHNHLTGKVRELICKKCNIAIGYVEEDLGRLRAISDYLIQHNEMRPESTYVHNS